MIVASPHRTTATGTARATLAKLIAGSPIEESTLQGENAAGLVTLAASEGVLALLGQRVATLRAAPAELRREGVEASRALAASGLIRESETRKVLARLPPGMPTLLLKGSALAYWLYPEPFLRECSDIDLLLPYRADAEHAAKLLETGGYAIDHHPDDLAYELLCSRVMAGGLRVDLDIHWALINAPVFAGVFSFEELHAASIVLPQLGAGARGLSPIHAFVHACLHRGANVYTGIGDRLKWLYDIHLLQQRFDPGEWHELVEVCRTRGISGICAEGILAAEVAFGPAAAPGILDKLNAARGSDRLDARRLGDWKYMEASNFAALDRWGLKVKWLWQRLVPPLGYLRALYGSDSGRASLLAHRWRRAITRLVP